MLKYFIIIASLFAISFPFPYDSHIGNEEKTEVGYMQHPALIGYTDTPKEGRVRIDYNWFIPSSISNTYNQMGDDQLIINDSKLSAFHIKMDYFGYKRSGVVLNFSGIKNDYTNESLTDLSLSTAGVNVYWIWGDKFTFPIYRIKTEVGLADISDAKVSVITAVDYYIADDEMLSASIGLNTYSSMEIANNDSSIFSYTPISLNAKFIHNFSENIAVSGMYKNTIYTEAPDELDINISSFQIAAGFQLTKLQYGYYHFNVGLKPALEFPISGKNHSKFNLISLGFSLDFI
tara:strand:- start:8745 stop:9614 length:870 start_codon:yes stop_codon:yes gene_type:complete